MSIEPPLKYSGFREQPNLQLRSEILPLYILGIFLEADSWRSRIVRI
jgi:hypothetical protein